MPFPIKYPDKEITLPIQYFGSVAYYAAMSAYGRVIIDDMAPFDKRFKSAHRHTIVDTHGLLQLTVPVSKPSIPASTAEMDTRRRKSLWSDVAISDHGHWWQVHQVSLESAYGRTPFFEFTADRFKPFFSKTTPISFDSVAVLDRALNGVVCAFLGIESEIIYASDMNHPVDRSSYYDFETVKSAEYYQVRRDKHGFQPSLSILDLIFNMGPESPLILKQCTI